MMRRAWKTIVFALMVVIGCLYGDKVYAANDSFATATSVSVNSVITDKMAYTNTSDYNYYKFTINKPGYISLDFSHAEEEYSSIGWMITLYDANKEEMNHMSSQRSQTKISSNNMGLAAGTYYVLVDNSGYSRSTISYQLKINYTASNDWETEFNDGFTTADTMLVNQTMNGSMMYEYTADYDYYKFTLNQPGYISMSFNHAELEYATISWYIILYDANREVIREMNSRQYQSYVISNDIGLPAGTYYISINNDWNAESTIDYRLKVNYTASNSWEREFNDGFTTANTLSINQTMNGGMIRDNGDDFDYFKFYLSKSGYVNLNFVLKQLPSNSAIWNVTLYNSYRQNIKDMQVDGSKKTNKLGMIYLSKGTYYVLIDNNELLYSPSTINYQLKVYYTTPKANISSAKSTSSKKMTLKWKKLKGVSGYEIVTATDKKFKKNKKITKMSGSKKVKTTIKKLKRKKTYYVKMRGFVVVDGQKYYGSYSAVKKVKVK